MNKKNVGIGVGILAGLGAAIGSFLAIRHCKKKREEALIDDFFSEGVSKAFGDELSHITPFGQSASVKAMGFGKVEPACKCGCCGKASCEPANESWGDDVWEDAGWEEELEPIEPQGDVVEPMDEATSSESDDTEEDDDFL